jgi:[NiFe] hydrogenase assembly HybE family chaperone
MTLPVETFARDLERHFQQVQQTRMAGVPILNPALRVQAVGFRHTERGCLGVLITPWFINLMLLPCEGDEWRERAPGSSQTHRFPSGNYTFLHAEEPGIGRYQSCSLLSPVLEIQDQDTAVQVAIAALQALDDERFRDLDSDTCEAEIARRWHAEPATEETPETPPTRTEEPAAPRAISRRELLFGRLRGENDTPA